MNKLYNYLIKAGAVEKPRRGYHEGAPIELYRVTYGDYYFYNAPNFIYNAFLICFDYNVEAGKEYFKNLRDIEEKIRKYARRFGYEIFNSTVNPWSRSFVIASRADREKAKTFYYYRDAAINAVNEAIHAAAVAGREFEQNELKNIMDTYGAAYNERLKAEQA